MKKLILIIILLLSIQANSQESFEKEIKSILPNKEVTIEILGIKSNPRKDELYQKFQEGIRKNYDWLLKTIKNRKDGERLSYHPNIGLTESEYVEMNKYTDDIELIPTESGNVKIIHRGETISFYGEGKFEFFNSIEIDLTKNVINIGELKLEFSHRPNILDSSNALKSKWSGFTWKFEEPNNLDFDSLKDLKNLNAKQYTFTIGKLERNGKIFISLKGKEFEDGSALVNFDLPMTF